MSSSLSQTQMRCSGALARETNWLVEPGHNDPPSRPVVVVEGRPDLVIVVQRERLLDASLRDRLPDVVHLVVEGEFRGVNPITINPSSRWARDQAGRCGSWHSQLMQVSVQKFTRMTWPRKSAEPSGSELSHSVDP